MQQDCSRGCCILPLSTRHEASATGWPLRARIRQVGVALGRAPREGRGSAELEVFARLVPGARASRRSLLPAASRPLATPGARAASATGRSDLADKFPNLANAAV